MLTKGQRMRTPYGPGTIVSFEQFDGHTGRSLEPSELDTGGRCIMKLDDESAWNNGEHGNPYISRNEMVNV